MATWKVPPGGQRQTMAIIGGRPVQAVEVTFTIDGGSSGAVVVPVDQYDADTVRALIEARVAEMAAVETGP